MSKYVYVKIALDQSEMLDALIADQSQWSQATFGSDEERGPIGPLKHLEKEAVEAQEAALNGTTIDFRFELADCLLLLLDATRRSGLDFWQLVRVARIKMEANKVRAWPKPVDDEPVEHVR